MTGRWQDIGWALLLELAPAALFGGAVAFAAAAALAVPLPSPLPTTLGPAAACGAWLLLRSFRGASEAFPMPQFEPVLIEAGAADDPGAADDSGGEDGDLLLDDVLVPLDPGSRVVRLFDRHPLGQSGAMDAPASWPLRSAVRPIPTPPDATEALHEALTALRQSLR